MTAPNLHTGRCYICHQLAECPVISYYDPDKVKIVRICSQKCLKEKKESDVQLAAFRVNFISIDALINLVCKKEKNIDEREWANK